MEQQRSLTVAAVAAHLGTTPITVRRDLAELESQGLLVRTHGGAVLPSVARHPVAFARKAAVNLPQKAHICQLAARQVAEGDTIFIDCGSTTFPLCALVRHLRIRVITNSLPVLFELVGSAAQVVIAGGEVDAGRQAVHGALAAEHLRRYTFDKAFLGADGLSLSRGLSANGEPEASISCRAGRSPPRVPALRFQQAGAGQVLAICPAQHHSHPHYRCPGRPGRAGPLRGSRPAHPALSGSQG
ncbi:MAG: DeoR/GlpR family DNA-binding transcription regulator [Hymenobacter sp.]